MFFDFVQAFFLAWPFLSYFWYMEPFYDNVSKESLIYLGVALLVLVILYWGTSIILKRLGKTQNTCCPKVPLNGWRFP